MTADPSYPEDAPVGAGQSEPRKDPEKKSEAARNKHLMTGAAIGIGSAAIVAALLYANRSKKN